MTRLENYVDSIHHSHLDNALNYYTARSLEQQNSKSISPLTNFVFEFFLFNSLYSIDWSASVEAGKLVAHDREKTETQQQAAFLQFCRSKFDSIDLVKVSALFLPLAMIPDSSGDWTAVTPDSRIELDEGKRFFRKVGEIGEMAKANQIKANKATKDLFVDCCKFIYDVRNNIFHGAKTLGEIYDPDQSRRISVYDVFVRCINSMFFLLMGKQEHAFSQAQFAIVQQCGSSTIRISEQEIYKLLRSRTLKREDSALHSHCFRNDTTKTVDSKNKTALFYPSAGSDILFPVIVGLPRCTDFYFFENSESVLRTLTITRMLDRLLNTRLRLIGNHIEDCTCYEFEFDSILRRLWLMRRDNLTFLDQDVDLAFYFHRGDSQGEGGSNQLWDSKLMPELLEKSDPAKGLRILTDGQWGGLLPSVAKQLERFELHSTSSASSTLNLWVKPL